MKKRTRKTWKRIIALLLAIALIAIDIPVSNLLKVSAGNESGNIVSIAYENGSFEILNGTTDVKYISTDNDELSITITLAATVETVYVDGTQMPKEANTVTCSISKDTEHNINADGVTAKIKWIKDTSIPDISKITNEDGTTTYTNAVVAKGTTVRVYVTEENPNKLIVNGSEVESPVQNDGDNKYYSYTFQTAGSYIFKCNDMAGKESNPGSQITVDDEGPAISDVTSSTGSALDKNNSIFYIDGDTASVRIYVTDNNSDIASIKVNDGSENTTVKTDGSRKYFECSVNASSNGIILKDTLGNTTETSLLFAKITEPQITALSGKDGNNYVSLSATSSNYTTDGRYWVYLDVTAGNRGNVQGIKYSTTNDIATANTATEIIGDKYVVKLSGISEETTYYFWAYDNKYKVSAVKSYKFDIDSDDVTIDSYSITQDTDYIFLENKYTLDVVFKSGVNTLKEVTTLLEKDVQVKDVNGVTHYYIEGLTKNQIAETVTFSIKKNVVNSSTYTASVTYKQNIAIISDSYKSIFNKADFQQENLDNDTIKFTVENETDDNATVKYSILKKVSDTKTNAIVSNVPLSADSGKNYSINFKQIISEKISGDGEYAIYINSSYKKKNCIQKIYITVDTQDPTANVTYADDGNTVNEDTISDLEVKDILYGISGEGSVTISITDDADTPMELDEKYLSNLSGSGKKLKLKEYVKGEAIENGTYTITVEVKDKAGNTATYTKTLVYDNTGVDFEANINDYTDGSWINVNSHVYTLSIDDIETGSYEISDVTATLKSGTNYATIQNMTLEPNDGVYKLDLLSLYNDGKLVEGSNKVTIKITNSAYDPASDSNSSLTYKTIEKEIKIDTVAPSKPIVNIGDYSSEWTRTSIAALATSTDETSQVAGVYFYRTLNATVSNDTIISNKQLYTNTMMPPSSTGLNDDQLKNVSGSYTYYIFSEDNAGNRSEIAKVENINFDISKPAITANVDETAAGLVKYTDSTSAEMVWYNKNVNVKYTMIGKKSLLNIAEHNARLINEYKNITVRNEKSVNALNYTGVLSTISETSNTDGKWTSEFYVKNVAGGKQKKNDLTFAIDTTKPKLTKNTVSSKNIAGIHYDDEEITISGTATDNVLTGIEGSGIKKIELMNSSNDIVTSSKASTYSFKLTNNGTYKGYYLKITDNVNNSNFAHRN